MTNFSKTPLSSRSRSRLVATASSPVDGVYSVQMQVDLAGGSLDLFVASTQRICSVLLLSVCCRLLYGCRFLRRPTHIPLP